MGLTHLEGVVTGTKEKKATIGFLVDSGAVYTLLAEKDWKAIGLKARRKMTFTLADGTTVERRLSECHISLPQGEGHTPVILGERGDVPVLGAVTLEVLGLVLDPFKRSLQPMRGVLASQGKNGARGPVGPKRSRQIRQLEKLFARWDKEDAELSEEEAARLETALNKSRGLRFRPIKLD